MADRISVRSASRQTTPQSPPKSTGSRSIAPQNPHQRNTHMTRSRSHDVSDSEESRAGARTTWRRGARQASTDAEDDTEKKEDGGDPRRKPKPRTEVQRDLPTVTEDPSIIYPDLPVTTENLDGGENRSVQRRSLHENKSPGGASAFSGTTARTSRSAQELLSLNAEDMLDTLQDLSDSSDKLLRLLLPPNVSEAEISTMRSDFKNPGSRLSKNFRRLCTSFQVPRDFYGNTFYIHAAAVLRIILGVKRTANIAYGPWRPDSVLQKANLCSLLMTVLMAPQKAEGDQVIDELEPVFPAPFLHGFVSSELVSTHAGSSALKGDTLKLGLEIRTQYAIIQLTRNATQLNFDPDSVLFQVFYQTDERLNGWDLAGMKAEAFSKDFENTIKHRITLIRQSFSEVPQASRTGQLVDINRLNAEFAWDEFVNELVAWSSARLDELQHQINIIDGGVGNIKLALEQKVEDANTKPIVDNDAMTITRNSPQVELDYEPPSELSHAPTETIETVRHPAVSSAQLNVFSHNSPKILPYKVDLFKQRFKSWSEPYVAQEAPMVPSLVHAAGTAPPPNHRLGPSKTRNEMAVTSSAPINETEGLEPQIQTDDHMQQAQSSESERDEPAAATQIMQIHAQDEAESGNRDLTVDLVRSSNEGVHRETRKPRLIDRQPGAVRVPFDSQGSTQGGPSNARGNVIEPVELGDEEEDQDEIEDVSQDVGFQMDTRPVDVNARRNAIPTDRRLIAEPITTTAQARKRARQSNETDRPRKRPRSMGRVPEPDDGDDGDDEDLIRRVTEQHNRDNASRNDPLPTQLENYKDAKSNAKSRNFTQIKKVQSRKAWTDQETEALMNLIEEHGTSWTLLKAIDSRKETGKQILKHRDQVALKDKARNMKLDYLKACVRLPENFHKIPLNKSQIHMLWSLGMEYNTDTGTLRERGLDPVESEEE